MSRLEKLEQMLQTDPEDPFLHYAVAKEYVAQGQIDEGRRRLTAVIETFPDLVASYFQLAQLMAQAGENSEALRTVERGIEVAERVGDAHAAGEMRSFRDALLPLS